jgi:uncharacterized protein (TIGR01244 family)
MNSLSAKFLPLILLGTILSASAKDDTPDVLSLSVKQIQADHELVTRNQYLSTDQPNKEVLEIVAAAGFQAVVDLRTEAEPRGIDEADEVTKLGMQYFSLPVGDTQDLTYENAQILQQILSGLDGPVLLHCASGNRVGALFALRERLNGASAEQALLVGRKAGLTRSENAVKSRLAEH